MDDYQQEHLLKLSDKLAELVDSDEPDKRAISMVAIGVLNVIGVFPPEIIKKLAQEAKRACDKDAPKSATTASKIWHGPAPSQCDLCHEAIAAAFVDGKTSMGPWANMCPDCFAEAGVGLGTGRGQMYQLRNGQWVKTGG